MWYQENRWRERLAAEQALMEYRFPQFVLRREASGGLAWEGIVEPVADYFFLVMIRYPTRYPYEEPHLRVIDPPLERNAPHVYPDGRVCVHRKNWNPERGTAASMVAVLSEWLSKYVRWLHTGQAFQ